MGPYLKLLTHPARLIRGIFKLIFFGTTVPTSFFVHPRRKLVFVVVPKTANSSIKNSLADESDVVEFSEEQIPLHKSLTRKYRTVCLSPKQRTYPAFAFVRNPFDRLVSCYVHKIKKSHNHLRGNYYGFASIKSQETFATFVGKVCRIPDLVADEHFRSQFAILHHFGRPLYKDLCHYETLEEDFKKLQDRFDLRDLPHVHNTKKGDWRTYYTPQLAHVVYKRYKKDFEKLGYRGELEKLLYFLGNK